MHTTVIESSKSWFGQPANRGLPIGNLISQFGANVYPTGLDHFVQRQLKPMAYQRYMDDLLLIDRDVKKLKTWAKPIDAWLQTSRFHASPLGGNSIKSLFTLRSGGESEIRTHGGVAPSPVFKTGAFNRSAISPVSGAKKDHTTDALRPCWLSRFR